MSATLQRLRFKVLRLSPNIRAAMYPVNVRFGSKADVLVSAWDRTGTPGSIDCGPRIETKPGQAAADRRGCEGKRRKLERFIAANGEVRSPDTPTSVLAEIRRLETELKQIEYERAALQDNPGPG